MRSWSRGICRSRRKPRTLMPNMSWPRGKNQPTSSGAATQRSRKRLVYLALLDRMVGGEIRKVHQEIRTDAFACRVRREQLHPARIDADQRLARSRRQAGDRPIVPLGLPRDRDAVAAVAPGGISRTSCACRPASGFSNFATYLKRSSGGTPRAWRCRAGSPCPASSRAAAGDPGTGEDRSCSWRGVAFTPYSAFSRYPTPGSVSMNRGAAGSSPSLLRSWRT